MLFLGWKASCSSASLAEPGGNMGSPCRASKQPQCSGSILGVCWECCCWAAGTGLQQGFGFCYSLKNPENMCWRGKISVSLAAWELPEIIIYLFVAMKVSVEQKVCFVPGSHSKEAPICRSHYGVILLYLHLLFVNFLMLFGLHFNFVNDFSVLTSGSNHCAYHRP